MKSNGLRRCLNALVTFCFPQDNTCHICGQPHLALGELYLCRHCQAQLQSEAFSPGQPPFFLDDLLPVTFTAYQHQGLARKLVHRLKFSSDCWIAPVLGEGMAAVFANADTSTLRQMELLVPIPLHPKRQRHRGYNQAELLAKSLSFHTGLPVGSHALRRIRNTRPQVGGNKNQRQRNMIGAFEVADPVLVYGKRILLIDDVCTTGSTAIACTQALKAFGAKEVMLLTVCKA